MAIRTLLTHYFQGSAALGAALIFGFLVVGCADTPPAPEKTEVTQAANPKVDAPTDSTPSEIAAATIPEAEEGPAATPGQGLISAKVVDLANRLKALGYATAGLEFETEATIERWRTAFNDPSTANRQISEVIRGEDLAYRAESETLTIGSEDAAAIVHFIQTNVPPRTKAKKPASKKTRRRPKQNA